jgi:hypothetical protein
MKRKALLALGVLLVLFGGALTRRPWPAVRMKQWRPLVAPLPVFPGSTLSRHLYTWRGETFLILLEVEPTVSQSKDIDSRPAWAVFRPEQPICVRYRVNSGSRVVAEGTRRDAPIAGPEGLAYLELTLGGFHGDLGGDGTLEVWIEDPVPDYGAAKTRLVVAASRPRQHRYLAEQRLAWLLMGPGTFLAGTILLLALLLLGAFRWRRRPPLRRGRDAVNLEGWKRTSARSSEPREGGVGSGSRR